MDDLRGIHVEGLVDEIFLRGCLGARVATGGKAGVTENIDLDGKAGMKLLYQQIDKAMRKFKRKKADFFNAYTSARIIVDLGGGHADPEVSPGTTAPVV